MIAPSWTNRLLSHAVVGTTWFFSVAGLFPPVSASESDGALHERIDAQIQASHIGPIAKISSDTDFVRRVYLDLIGRIPSRDEARRFLDDSSSDKRVSLVDRLLADGQCDEYLASVLDVMLMERRADKRISADEWRQYLRDSISSKKPFDQIAREILAADGVDPATRPAAKFYLDRDVETHAITRDVSRMFFGRDVQCAQCHDHPVVNDYHQSEYYGVVAFLNRSFLFEDEKDNKKAYLAERAEGDATFKSVFEPDAPQSNAFPQLVDGLGWDDEPQTTLDEAYQAKPDKNVRGVTTHSRRQRLAQLVVRTGAFKRNAVNRLWDHMLGRGFVDPIDFHHADNPPTHPKLLRTLADEFALMNYDIKGFIKEIALSVTYQRSIDLPSIGETDWVAAEQALPQLERQLEFQQVVCQQANSDVELASNQLERSRAALTAARGEIQISLNAINDATAKLREAQAEFAKITDQLSVSRQSAEQLGIALNSAKVVAEKKPDDTELAQVLATLRTRAASFLAEAGQFEVQAKEKQAAIDELNSTIAKSRSAVVNLTPERDQLAELGTEHRGGYLAIATKRATELNLAIDLQQKIKECRQLIEHRDRIVKLQTAAAHADQRNSELSALQQKASEAEGERTRFSAELVSHRTEHDAAQLALDESAKKAGKHAESLAALHDAIAKTEQVASQLGSDESLTSALEQLRSKLDRLRVEQVSVESAKSKCEDQVKQSSASLDQLTNQLTSSADGLAQLNERIRVATTEFESARSGIDGAKVAVDSIVEEIATSWTARFVAGSLKSLSPEQLAASTMQALGMDQQFRQGAEEEWKAQLKDKTPEQVDPQQRLREIELLYKKRRKSIESTFVSLFAAPPASPQDIFSATVDQALYFANDGGYRGWLGTAASGLNDRLKNATDSRTVIDDLFLSILTRKATDDEIAEASERLATPEPNRAVAAQDLCWSLLTSVEFRFNH